MLTGQPTSRSMTHETTEPASTRRDRCRKTVVMRPSDAGVLRQIADGDREAFRSLVTDIGPRAMSLAVRVTANRQLAEEAVQEALVDVWTKARRFDASRGGVHQWVLTLVHHK